MKKIIDLFFFVPGRKFPDKAIDLMDEACTTVKLRASKQRETNAPGEVLVGQGHVTEVIPNHMSYLASTISLLLLFSSQLPFSNIV